MIGKYSFFAVGENLAAGQETTADVIRVWMESPSHKAIILDERWSELGMAVRLGGDLLKMGVDDDRRCDPP